MPIYEYRCKSCGQHLEIIQRVGDSPRRRCDQCGGRLEKLISRTAFVLKGGGWYAEGYTRGGSGRKKETTKEAASAGGGDSKSSSSTPSKGGGATGSGKQSASAT